MMALTSLLSFVPWHFSVLQLYPLHFLVVLSLLVLLWKVDLITAFGNNLKVKLKLVLHG